MSKKLKKLILKIVTIITLTLSIIPTITYAKAGDTPNKTIILDRCHMDTYNDVGASYNGYDERSIANDITNQVGERLSQKGYNVVYTRSMDKPISLQARKQLCYNTEYDYYISIHCNSSSSGQGTGTEGFYNKGSKQLTENIIKSISENLGLTYRRVEQSPYYNRSIEDSTIIELGFINNEEDLQKLLKEQDTYVNIIVDSIEQQYNNQTENQSREKVHMGDGTYIYRDCSMRIKNNN